MSYSAVGRKIVNDAPGFIISISFGSCVGRTRGSAIELIVNMSASRKRVLDDEDGDGELAVKRYCSLVHTYAYPLVDGVVAYTPSKQEIHIPGAILHNASNRVYCAGGLVTWLDAETGVWRQTSLVDETYDITYPAPTDVSTNTVHACVHLQFCVCVQMQARVWTCDIVVSNTGQPALSTQMSMMCVMPGGTILRMTEVVTGWGEPVPIRNWPPSVIEIDSDTLVVFEFVNQFVHRHVLTRACDDTTMAGQSVTTTWEFTGPVVAVAVDADMHTMIVKVMGCKVRMLQSVPLSPCQNV